MDWLLHDLQYVPLERTAALIEKAPNFSLLYVCFLEFQVCVIIAYSESDIYYVVFILNV